MATFRKRKKSQKRAKHAKIARARASNRRTPEVCDGLGNPLEIALPSSYLSFEQAQKILAYKNSQEKMWSYAVALAIILFFILSVMELGSFAGFWGPLSDQTYELIEKADLMAIFVLGVEMAAQLKKSTNKMLYLQKNWLGIVAILPMGLFFRVARLAEGAEAIRALQLGYKFSETNYLAPLVAFMRFEKPIARVSEMVSEAILTFQLWIAHYSVLTDFIELVITRFRQLFR